VIRTEAGQTLLAQAYLHVLEPARAHAGGHVLGTASAL